MLKKLKQTSIVASSAAACGAVIMSVALLNSDANLVSKLKLTGAVSAACVTVGFALDCRYGISSELRKRELAQWFETEKELLSNRSITPSRALVDLADRNLQQFDFNRTSRTRKSKSILNSEYNNSLWIIEKLFFAVSSEIPENLRYDLHFLREFLDDLLSSFHKIDNTTREYTTINIFSIDLLRFSEKTSRDLYFIKKIITDWHSSQSYSKCQQNSWQKQKTTKGNESVTLLSVPVESFPTETETINIDFPLMIESSKEIIIPFNLQSRPNVYFEPIQISQDISETETETERKFIDENQY